MRITTSPTVKPPPHLFYGDSYQRGVDPWHRDAFPDELKNQAPNQSPKRRAGWFLQDGWGQDIDFTPDGTTYETSAITP